MPASVADTEYRWLTALVILTKYCRISALTFLVSRLSGDGEHTGRATNQLRIGR